MASFEHALKNGDISEASDKSKGTPKRKLAKNKSQKKNSTTPLKQWKVVTNVLPFGQEKTTFTQRSLLPSILRKRTVMWLIPDVEIERSKICLIYFPQVDQKEVANNRTGCSGE